MKKQINSTIKAHLMRGAFCLRVDPEPCLRRVRDHRRRHGRNHRHPVQANGHDPAVAYLFLVR